MNKFLRWVGFYEENKHLKLDMRRVYYLVIIPLVIYLEYDALFRNTITMDNWGMTSPYLIKLLIISIGLFLIWFFWGYLRLLKRVSKLEKEAGENNA
jgi:hypothetical protein